jgi:hypothetical protein
LDALETLGVRGPRKGHAVLGAYYANLLQEAEFNAEYDDHAELLELPSNSTTAGVRGLPPSLRGSSLPVMRRSRQLSWRPLPALG